MILGSPALDAHTFVPGHRGGSQDRSPAKTASIQLNPIIVKWRDCRRGTCQTGHAPQVLDLRTPCVVLHTILRQETAVSMLCVCVGFGSTEKAGRFTKRNNPSEYSAPDKYFLGDLLAFLVFHAKGSSRETTMNAAVGVGAVSSVGWRGRNSSTPRACRK